MPWKANHDLKDQVGNESIHCDIGFFQAQWKAGNAGNIQEAAAWSLTGITTCKSYSIFLFCDVNKVQYTKENIL